MFKYSQMEVFSAAFKQQFTHLKNGFNDKYAAKMENKNALIHSKPDHNNGYVARIISSVFT